MRTQTAAALAVAIAGVIFSTVLLATHLVGSVTFIPLIGLFLAVALVLYLAERLREFSLRDLSFKLREAKQAKAEAEALYSKIDHLQQATMQMDRAKVESLGMGGHMVNGVGLMRYITGCIKRERERLARIFAEAKSPEKIARAILDSSFDDNVFKFNGPEVPLDVPPTSLEERAAKDKAVEQGDTSTSGR